MELIDYRKAPPGSKYVAEIDVYYDKTFYRRIRVMLSQKGNYFINIPVYGVDDGFGAKKWIPYWEFSKEEDSLFRKHCLDLIRPLLKESDQGNFPPVPSYTKPPVQTEFQPDLSGCPF